MKRIEREQKGAKKMKRNYFEAEVNVKIGVKLREAREKEGLSQEKLAEKFNDFLCRDLRRRGFSDDEIEDYLSGKMTEKEETRFKNAGLVSTHGEIAVSTISNYENGVYKVPYAYVYLLENVLEQEISL